MISCVLLTSFVVGYFTHLTSRVPILGVLRLDLVLAAATLLTALLRPGEDKFRWSIPASRRLAVFLLYIIASLPLVTWPGSVVRFNLTVWIKAAMFFVLLVTAVRTERQLKWFMFIFLGAQSFRILEPLYLHATTGYWGDIAYSSVGDAPSALRRLSGAPHDVVNANQYAWLIVNMVPFLYFLCWRGGRWGKLVFLATMPAFGYGLFLTGSRSGLISFLVVVAAVVALSEKKLRNGLLVGGVTVCGLTYLFVNSDSLLKERYLSIIDRSVAGADTAQGRLDGIIRQVGSLRNNPLFGNGIGTSIETNVNVTGARAQPTHNLYLELLQETGVVGFVIFMTYIMTMAKALYRSRRALLNAGGAEVDWVVRLMSAILAWITMDLVYSLSCFGVSSWEWYLFGGVAGVSLALARNKVAEGPSQVSDDRLPAACGVQL